MIFERLAQLDRRWYYAVFALVILLPLIKPVGLPTSTSSFSRQMKEQLDQVKAGDKVLLALVYTVSAAPDVHPGTEIAFKYLMAKGARVVVVSFEAQSAMIAEKMLRPYEAAGKKYGTDFVNLGYVAGQEAGLAAFVSKPSTLSVQDFRGNNVSSLPLMSDLKTASDFQIGILSSGSVPGVEEWARQVSGPFKLKSLAIYNTTGAAKAIPYLQSGQIRGLLFGLRGAAELELLTKMPGPALAGMDAQSMGHLFIVLLVIFSNIGYLMSKSRGQKAPGGRA